MSGAARWLLLAALPVVVTACAESGDSTEPRRLTPETPPAIAPGSVWGHVYSAAGGGSCLLHAVVEIIEGPGTGRTSGQEPCDYWNFGGGFEFTDLPLAKMIKLRATAKGFTPVERSVMTGPNRGPVRIELTPE